MQEFKQIGPNGQWARMVVVGTKRDFADGLGVAGERKGWYDCGFEFEHLCFNVPVKTRHPAAPYVEDYYGQRELRMGTAERSQLAGGGE